MPHDEPAKPVKHEHVPSVLALPWELQVVALEYWQALPTQGALHEQAPLPASKSLQRPLFEQGVAAPPGQGVHSDPQYPD